MRTSPTHYIAPASISIIPNANASVNDLAVYIARRARLKVYSPKVGIDTLNGNYQEWVLSGRNRRLADGEAPYTIYARLLRYGRTGYLVFTKKVKEGNTWLDRYAYITPEGISRGETDEDFFYVRLGEVTSPESGKRSVVLDTGVLDTDEFNTKWALNPDALPLRIGLGCTINDEDVGQTPYVYWGQTLELSAILTEGWTGTEAKRFDHWQITRDTGDVASDNMWNHPNGENSYRGMSGGRISLRHDRDDDDFNSAVAATFTITAWGMPKDTASSSPGALEALATVVITIHAETWEKYEIDLSSSIVSFDPTTNAYVPSDGVTIKVRATDQRGDFYVLTRSQIVAMGISAEYAAVGSDIWESLSFSGAHNVAASAVIPTGPTSVFAAQRNVNVRLTRILHADGENASEVVELNRSTIAFVRDGEDSREREWIFMRSDTAIVFGDASSEHPAPRYITVGQVNPEGEASGADARSNQQGWVPQGWWNNPQGTTEAIPYEYGAYRDFEHNAQGGTWGAFSQPRIWSHFGADSYMVQAAPAAVSFDCNNDGQSIDTGVRQVTLSMYKGHSVCPFVASVAETTHCAAWVTNNVLYISTGAAWESGGNTYYTDKPYPYVSPGDAVYDVEGNEVGHVVLARLGYITITGSSLTFAVVRGASYHNLSQGGRVRVNANAEGQSLSAVVIVIGNRKGEDSVTHFLVCSPTSVSFRSDDTGNFSHNADKTITCAVWKKRGDDAAVELTAEGGTYEGLHLWCRRAYADGTFQSWREANSDVITGAMAVDGNVSSVEFCLSVANTASGIATSNTVATVTCAILSDGRRGAVGRMFRPRGVFDAVAEYVRNEYFVDLIFFDDGTFNSINNARGHYYYLSAAYSSNVDGVYHYAPAATDGKGNTYDYLEGVWVKADDMGVVITQAVFAEFAKMGSAIMSGDFMYSAYANNDFTMLATEQTKSDETYTLIDEQTALEVKAGVGYKLTINGKSSAQGQVIYIRIYYLDKGYDASVDGNWIDHGIWGRNYLVVSSPTDSSYELPFVSEYSGWVKLYFYGYGTVRSVVAQTSGDYTKVSPMFINDDTINLLSSGVGETYASDANTPEPMLRTPIAVRSGMRYDVTFKAMVNTPGETLYVGVYSGDLRLTYVAVSENSFTPLQLSFVAPNDSDVYIKGYTTNGVGLISDVYITPVSPYIPMAAVDWLTGYAHFCGGKTRFNPDGSGKLAGGNISWDAHGNCRYEGSVYAHDGVFNGTVVAKNGNFSGFLRKTPFHITLENRDDYMPQNEGGGGSREIKFSETGSFLVLDEGWGVGSGAGGVKFQFPSSRYTSAGVTDGSNLLDSLSYVGNQVIMAIEDTTPSIRLFGYFSPSAHPYSESEIRTDLLVMEAGASGETRHKLVVLECKNVTFNSGNVGYVYWHYSLSYIP